MAAEYLRRDLQHSLEEIIQIIVLQDVIKSFVYRHQELGLEWFALCFRQCLPLTQLILKPCN